MTQQPYLSVRNLSKHFKPAAFSRGAVVKALHDAFKKAMDDPRHIEVLKQLNQDAWYRSGADYAQWVREAYAKDKVLIDRLGLAAK